MGIVQRDSIRITVISYIGAAIGYLNKILLFTNFLSVEQVGLANILISIAAVYAQFSGMGMTGIAIRFFPYFKNRENHHNGFLFWASFISLFGFLLITLLFYLFQGPVIGYYSEKSPLLVQYSLYLIPLGLAMVYYNLLEVYLRSLMKTVVFSLVNEIALRVMISCCIGLFAFGQISFDEFVMLYVGINCSTTLLLLIYTAWLKQLLVRPVWSTTTRRFFRIALNYGMYAILGNMSYILMNNIDALMVASMAGMKDTGVFTTAFFLATVMLIPYRSLARVASPLVAQFWKNREMKKMEELYKKVTLMNLLSGCFLFLALWLNIDSILALMPEEYARAKYVFLFLGLGRLVDMATGLNGIILVTSKKFRYDLLFTALLVALMAGLNLAFIPSYGIAGAAFATMLSIMILNLLRIFFIGYQFGIQPFEKKCVWVILLALASFAIVSLLPNMGNIFADLMVRTALLCLIFIVPALALKISPDANQYASNLLGFLKKKS